MPLDLYSKGTTDTLLAGKLDLSGGTMTGALNLSVSGIIFSDATYLTTAPAGSTLAADQLTAGVVTANPTTGPTASGDVLQYTGTDLVWAAGGGGGGVAWGAITGTVTDQTDLTAYLSSNYYPSSNPSGFISSVPTKSVNNVFGPYTLVAGDANNIVNFTEGSGNTLFVPQDSTYDFPVGTTITLVSYNTTNLINSEDTSSPGYPFVNNGYGGAFGNYVVTLVKIGPNYWFYA